MTRLDEVVALLDQAHQQDPHQQESDYAKSVLHWLDQLLPQMSEKAIETLIHSNNRNFPA